VDDGIAITIATPWLTINRTLIAGFAFKLSAIGNAGYLCTFRGPDGDGASAAYENLDIRVTANAALNLWVAGVTNNTTANNIVSANTWYYFEMKAYCDNSAGTVEVRLDGTPVMTYTGDTQFGAATPNYFSSFAFRGGGNLQRITVDDLYICDASGSTNNDFLGDCRVQTIWPDGDASGNMTANSGTDEYAMVNSHTLNTSNYIKDTTSGNQSVFAYEALPITPNTVLGVMVTTESMLSGNLMLGHRALSQNGAGTINATTQLFPTTAWTEHGSTTELFETNADGSAWTPNLISDARWGVRVV
jgi:hypothetical protein